MAGQGGRRRGSGRKGAVFSKAVVDTGGLSAEQVKAEIYKCSQSPSYFVQNYVFILDKAVKRWIPFEMWPAQDAVLRILGGDSRETIILKARQLGITWLVLAYALWQMLFEPIANILLFSLREDEAVLLLDERLKGMYAALPGWLQCRDVEKNDRKTWRLSNGSTARAFSTKGGDSHAATFAVVDEADLVPDLYEMIGRIAPTIEDGGGRFCLISRASQDAPNSAFKRIYRAAKGGNSTFKSIFLPWYAHPNRTKAWYEAKKASALAENGSLDVINAQYPSTDIEALAPSTLNKRFPHTWLTSVYVEGVRPLGPESVPTCLAPLVMGSRLAGKGAPLRIYVAPVEGREYVSGADPAEGIDGGDDSGLAITDLLTGAVVAHLAGKYEPKEEFGQIIVDVCTFFNNCPTLPERNNHGHAVIAYIEKTGREGKHAIKVLDGLDGKPGWLSHQTSKVDACDDYAEVLKNAHMSGGVGPERNGPCLYDFRAYTELASIDRVKLSHPEKRKGATAVDDEATSVILANKARSLRPVAKNYFW